jgi:hypothetical protein
MFADVTARAGALRRNGDPATGTREPSLFTLNPLTSTELGAVVNRNWACPSFRGTSAAIGVGVGNAAGVGVGVMLGVGVAVGEGVGVGEGLSMTVLRGEMTHPAIAASSKKIIAIKPKWFER